MSYNNSQNTVLSDSRVNIISLNVAFSSKTAPSKRIIAIEGGLSSLREEFSTLQKENSYLKEQLGTVLEENATFREIIFTLESDNTVFWELLYDIQGELASLK